MDVINSSRSEDGDKGKTISAVEKKEIFDPTDIAALIDKSKENLAETDQKTKNITQSERKSISSSSLTLSEEDS